MTVRALVVPAFLCALLLLLTALPVAAQPAPFQDDPKLPDTPAYRRALELLELVNANDPAKVRAYIQEAFTPEFRDMVPLEEHLSVFAGVVEASRGYEAHAARVYDPPRPVTNATLIVRNRLTDAWEAIVVDVTEAPPYLIARFNFAPARTPSDLPKPVKLSEPEVAAELGAFLDRLVAADAFSGTVLVAKDGTPFFTRVAGIANRDFMVPNKLDTKFNTGSMFKMLTALGAAQLADQGKLLMDAPIADYLDTTWLSQDILDRVTVRQLLTHTSGLGSYFNETYDRSSRLLFRKVDDYKMLVKGDTLAFEPGTGWQYSNTGFLLLGAIIESASGEDYFDYIRTHVTGPAGMKNTDCYELDMVNENLAVGYDREPGPRGPFYRNNIFQHVLRGGPAGGGYTTVEDLLALDRALRGGKLVSAATLEAMWTPSPLSGPPGSGYGYGFGISQTPIGKMVGHNGGFAGISADFAMYLDAGYTVAILSNYGSGMQPVHQKVRDLLERTD
jgi:CubicO group peptidase (beta-lactamase class C family)